MIGRLGWEKHSCPQLLLPQEVWQWPSRIFNPTSPPKTLSHWTWVEFLAWQWSNLNLKNGLGTECMVYINKSCVDVIVCKCSFFNSAYISCQSSVYSPHPNPSTVAWSSRESEVKITVEFTHTYAVSEALCMFQEQSREGKSYGWVGVRCSDFE